MKKHLPLALLCLAALLPFTLAAAEEEAVPDGAKPGPAVDIMKIKPGDLVTGNTREFEAKAHAAYQAKKYREAARHYIEVLRRNPGDANSAYNLACCFGLMGAADQAAAFLDAAWKAGFTDLGHIQRDPDFDKVREEKVFAKVVEELTKRAEEKRKSDGIALEVTAEVLADVRVILPGSGELEPYKRYPLLVGLHGYGAKAENFSKLFSARDLPVDFLYCVPQAPYAFGSGNIGYSWDRPIRDRRGSGARSHLLSEEYILRVIEAVKDEFPVDEQNVFLMGFSQGAGLASWIGMRHPEEFRGVIPIGGWLDEKGHSMATVRNAAENGRFLLCHATDDRVVPYTSAESTVEFFTKYEIPHELVKYEGGHSIPKSLAEKVIAWMKAPAGK